MPETLDILSRIVHVATAIVLVGGTVFSWAVLPSGVQNLSESARENFTAALTQRWKRFVHLGILLFLISGFYNFFRQIPKHQGDSLYHGLVGTKILLAFALFFIASALVGRSPRLESMRINRSFWLRAAVVLAAVIVAISSVVKVRGGISGE